ncbi:phosphomannomutase/phosphoglucomutase [Pseudomonas aeruginosa]|uniref:phosphomannomutase/phosphoglucomutase n=1 Tax=Pseudomonas aeruginosa TaxID=287 RepID=UPI000D6A45BA|nr:phosphomannomutase/phosphoglucomutase [Pseudomonas aeruginosa]
MKLFQRTAKDGNELGDLLEPEKKPRKAASERADGKDLLPGIGASLLGVAAAGALLWFGVFGGATRIEAAQRSLLAWDGVVDAHLNAPGQAAQDNDSPGPVSFAALDILHRVESGQNVAAEAYKVGQRWLLYSAAPVRGADQSLQGTLLLAVDLQRLLRALPPLPGDAGQVQLVQQFSGAPAQVLLQRGTPAPGKGAQALDSGNPNWKLNYTPGSVASTQASPLLLALAALLALLGGILGTYLTRSSLLRRLHQDVLTLGQYLQELGGQRTAKPPVPSLPGFAPLIQALARQPRRKPEPTSVPSPAKAAPVAPVAVAKAPPREEPALADPLFQNTDILDIDILDEDQDLLGLEQTPIMSTAKAPTLPVSIFRAYDIRGVVGDTLTAETAYWIGRAIGSESLARGEPCVAVGRDGRLSGPELVKQLIQGLVDCGCQVSDVGMVPTPVLYYAANVLEGKSGVMLTGSHNPPDYNGFKIVVAGETLANEQIQALRERIEKNDLASGVGSVEQVDILPRYFKQIRDDIAMAKPMKVVVDCGNGVAGVIAPQLIEALGCSVIPLYCEVDGNFPNHHPDPGKPENLKDLIAKVKAENADLGLAFDGDGDRVGVVTNTGTIIYPDRLLMLFAKDVVSRNPGADIIFDVKCTRRLIALISGYGGRPVMWKTGHSLIKKKMKETGALLAGEMSGHVFFKERWFGFDDGIYSAARLLEILSQDQRDSEHVFSAFPSDISTPEINITVTEDSKFAIIEALQRDAQWGEGNITTLDGVRVDYPKGWGLVRASNTTPVLVLRFEADTEEELERIKTVFRNQLKAVDSSLPVPF